MTDIDHYQTKLAQTLTEIGPLAIAVSGGVDSLTLAHAAHRQLGGQATMFHAVSPAVPPQATARVRRQAEHEGWRLQVIDAGEYDDPDYRRNPVNRCFYCKTNLYATIARHTKLTIASGTNLDDLGDYRPGLEAAEHYGVRHPFVEAGIDKATVRALARDFRLGDIAELPAAPCLSSRIETGIAIDAVDLGFVHRVETLLSQTLKPQTVRCRIRQGGVYVELDERALTALYQHPILQADLKRLCSRHDKGEPQYTIYRRGSAFLHQIDVRVEAG